MAHARVAPVAGAWFVAVSLHVGFLAAGADVALVDAATNAYAAAAVVTVATVGRSLEALLLAVMAAASVAWHVSEAIGDPSPELLSADRLWVGSTLVFVALDTVREVVRPSWKGRAANLVTAIAIAHVTVLLDNNVVAVVVATATILAIVSATLTTLTTRRKRALTRLGAVCLFVVAFAFVNVDDVVTWAHSAWHAIGSLAFAAYFSVR